jgi:transposase
MFWQGNLIELSFTKRSFFCWKCKKKGLPWITLEQSAIIPKNKRFSLAWADQVLKGLGSTTFKTQEEIAKACFSTIRKLLSERIDPFIGVWPKDMVIRSIGIDLHSFSGTTMLPTVCNLTDHRLITILPDNKQPTMRKFLQSIPEDKKKSIEEVCIDMDCHYIKLIHEELPSARIVIDFFHIVQDANFRITEVRTVIQKAGKVQLSKKIGRAHV